MPGVPATGKGDAGLVFCGMLRERSVYLLKVFRILFVHSKIGMLTCDSEIGE